ncbi:lithostathine-1-beta-like [Nerophis lumbriciformis]|uniref:lithostathine-1-beta-like n=1 Tax=Nerophis lumbriciformis TaxID=546530 RepID=UPI003BAC83C4
MAYTRGVFFLLFGISGLLTGAWSWPRFNDKAAGGCCPSGWTLLDHHCYIFQGDPRTFADAESVCNILGGNLVSIRSYVDNLLVVGLVKEGGVDFAWIGLHDAIQEGDFLWTDGTDFDFNNFQIGEPDGTGACVELYAADGTFFDEDCAVEHAYVCIRDRGCDSH